MKILCKVAHNFEKTFSVLTKHYPDLTATAMKTTGNFICGKSFRYVRSCKRCGLEQSDLVDWLGYTTWIDIELAKEKIRQHETNTTKDER